MPGLLLVCLRSVTGDALPRTSLLLEAPRGKISLYASTDLTGKGDDFLLLAPRERRQVTINTGAGSILRLWYTASTIERLSVALQIDGGESRRFMDNGKLRYQFASPLSSYYERAFACYDTWQVRRQCVLLVENHATESNKFFYQVNFRSVDSSPGSTAAEVPEQGGGHAPSIDGKPEGRWERLLKEPGIQVVRLGSARQNALDESRLRRPGLLWAARFPLAPSSKPSVLKVSWDGNRTSAIDVPVPSFVAQSYAVGDYSSAFMGSQGGYGYCFFPMPFQEASITVSPGLSSPVELLWQPVQSVPAQRFHAVHAKEVTRTGSPFHLARISGKGWLVGVSLAIDGSQRHTYGFLEGNEVIMTDGNKLEGTGTEDFFNSAWYFPKKPFCFPLHGMTCREEAKRRIEAYRWMLAERIPFERELTVTLQHGRNNGTAGCVYEAVTSFYADPATTRMIQEPSAKPARELRSGQHRTRPGLVAWVKLFVGVILLLMVAMRLCRRKPQR